MLHASTPAKVSYQRLYSRFMQANQGKQHFACHSHYYWPDVTRDAMLQYWDDSARLVDDKWDYIFGQKMPTVQARIAEVLHTQQPQQIAFAPNTHELLYRILSCLDMASHQRILTTDSEFHSFHRQINRLNERDNIELEIVPCQPFDTFEARFKQKLKDEHFDMVFVSQVFFNSGVGLVDINGLVAAVPNDECLVVIDGYHGFMAVPTDLSRIKDRIFYLAGSYKYAQGGEGCCFVHVPGNCQLRPEYTGWFAEFGELDAAKSGQVNYSTDGMRFAGSTMDFSALYRLDAVFNMMEQENLSVSRINAYVRELQRSFLARIGECFHPLLNHDHLLINDARHHGHFFAFQLDNAEQVKKLAEQLKNHNILVDYRSDRIRFGFALYHNAKEYDFSCLRPSG